MNKIAFFLILALSFCIAFSASSKSFSIPNAYVDYYLNPDGTVSVTEKVTYSLSGSFTELYLQKPKDLQITDASGYCVGADCSFYTQINQGYLELVAKGNFHNQQVTAVFDYKINGEILAQKDSTQFFWKVWGDTTQERVGNLVATIHLPGSASETTYFIHPVSDSIKATAGSNAITITSPNHPAETYLEINLLMPKEWFSGLRQAPNFMTKSQIVSGETGYIQGMKNTIAIYSGIFWFGIIALPVLFIALYLIYGREKPLSQLEFLAPYEHEPPGELSPAEALYLIERKMKPDAISGEMLYLVQKKFLNMEEKEVDVQGLLGSSRKKRIAFSLGSATNQPSQETLKPHQRILLGFINQNMSNGIFFVEDLDEDRKARPYALFYRTFSSMIAKSFSDKKYIDGKANSVMGLAAGIAIIVSFIGAWLFSSTLGGELPLFLIFESILITIIVLSKPQLLGKWSDEGRIAEQRWKNFKRYLSDMTLMREKKVDSIVLWELYLVYATAFGVSKVVLEAMKVILPMERSNSSLFLTHAIYVGAISHSFSTATATATQSSGSSHGGFGGGGGGGGGGAGAR
ncbi:MAG: DUF2207 domain-containing protein [Candidatus Micrarchaeia archaeon]